MNVALPSPGEPTGVKRFRDNALPPEVGNDLGPGVPAREGCSPRARLALARGKQRLWLSAHAACCRPDVQAAPLVLQFVPAASAPVTGHR